MKLTSQIKCVLQSCCDLETNTLIVGPIRSDKAHIVSLLLQLYPTMDYNVLYLTTNTELARDIQGTTVVDFLDFGYHIPDNIDELFQVILKQDKECKKLARKKNKMKIEPTSSLEDNHHNDTVKSRDYISYDELKRKKLTCTSTKKETYIPYKHETSVLERIKAYDVIVFCDVFSVHPKLFDTVDLVSRIAKDKNQPFGNITVVSIGDPFQLPPLQDFTSDQSNSVHTFDSVIFTSMFQAKYEMNHVSTYNDPDFAELLNRVRLGALTRQDMERLKTRCLPVPEASLTTMVKVCCFKNEVLEHNAKLLKRLLKTEASRIENRVTWDAKAHSKSQNVIIKEVDKRDIGRYMGIGDITREYGIGCLVALTHDLDTDVLRRGSIGTIVSLDQNKLPIVQLLGSRDLHCIAKHSVTRVHPIHGKITVRFTPLMLSWATTVHKILGKTFPKAIVGIKKGMWETGQAYVALSCVTSLSHLYITELDSSGIKTSPKCLDFINNITWTKYHTNVSDLETICHNIRIEKI